MKLHIQKPKFYVNTSVQSMPVLALILDCLVRNRESLFKIILLNITSLWEWQHCVGKHRSWFSRKLKQEGTDRLEFLFLLQATMKVGHISPKLILQAHITTGKQLQLERMRRTQKFSFKKDSK
jgi:hypothetical protein